MKKFFVLILCCACFSAVSTGQTKKAKGAQPLFTANLSNAEYDASVWSVDKSGVISATADKTLWTSKEYENFEITLEFKTDKCTNSGVIIYATDKENWIPNSVEVQIFDDYCVEHETKASIGTCGAIYGHLAPNAYQLVKKPGEWNTMKVTAKGRSIKVELNGKKITDMDMSKWTSGSVNPDGSAIPSWLPKPFSGIPTKGYIGFQGKHGQALIWFKNIKIRQL